MVTKDWEKIDDDYVQRKYINQKKGTKLRVLKPLTGRTPKVEICAKNKKCNLRTFYSLKSATAFSKSYMKSH